MSRSRRKPQPNLPFAAAFALIQMLRDPGQRSEETMSTEQNDSALTKGQSGQKLRGVQQPFGQPYSPFETDYLRSAASSALPKSLPHFRGMDCGGEQQ
ncbi:hypothetical protein B9G55_11790 [Saccharibacillus sp. O16]|nr:hypothetical protein B9G55_11790 [Saccharibacillus sp. O16]